VVADEVEGDAPHPADRVLVAPDRQRTWPDEGLLTQSAASSASPLAASRRTGAWRRKQSSKSWSVTMHRSRPPPSPRAEGPDARHRRYRPRGPATPNRPGPSSSPAVLVRGSVSPRRGHLVVDHPGPLLPPEPLLPWSLPPRSRRRDRRGRRPAGLTRRRGRRRLASPDPRRRWRRDVSGPLPVGTDAGRPRSGGLRGDVAGTVDAPGRRVEVAPVAVVGSVREGSSAPGCSSDAPPPAREAARPTGRPRRPAVMTSVVRRCIVSSVGGGVRRHAERARVWSMPRSGRGRCDIIEP
jgi:hypothetical protein